MKYLYRAPCVAAGLIVGLACGIGCSMSESDGVNTPVLSDQVIVEAEAGATDKTPNDLAPVVADRLEDRHAETVQAVKARLDGLGSKAQYKIQPDQIMTEIIIQDGSSLAPQDIALFGQLAGLKSLQIHNCRDLNDAIVAQLTGLETLTTLALTNSVITDAAVEMIVKSFPDLTNLDLSYNTNVTNGALKTICTLPKLERLTLIQNRFNDLGTSHLEKLKTLRVLDLRGNMEAGDMTMEILGTMPKLVALKHRSTAVTDFGMEYLAASKTLSSFLMQDFAVTDQSGEYLAKLKKLTQLEVFRCQGFGTQGVLALEGMQLTRLKLRDLPRVDDSALDVFQGLPDLKRLELHEINSIGDAGLKNIGLLQALEVLDIWSVPRMTDATMDVIATLPNLKELSIRATGVTDAAIDTL
ncbi:MAG: hypothetical protein JW829_07775, partial [Pirellulales bacterium]|nr:hypothetical protein [Pirellulales bacterium]